MTSTSIARPHHKNTNYGNSNYAKAASNDSGSDTEKKGTAIMTLTSMARPSHKNTNDGNGNYAKPASNDSGSDTEKKELQS
jgi:PKD repeat protein